MTKKNDPNHEHRYTTSSSRDVVEGDYLVTYNQPKCSCGQNVGNETQVGRVLTKAAYNRMERERRAAARLAREQRSKPPPNDEKK